MTEDGGLHERGENSGEPNTVPPQQNSLDEPGHHHFGPAPPPGGIDESRVCLLDTACTSCMHSKKWREAYESTLPEGMSCSPTASTKSFHFANGATTDERATVWRIPIFLEGHKGEVFSAEITSGSTPLPLSIAAMTALDMVLHVREQLVEVKSLNLQLPMLVTQSRHLAIEVCYKEELGIKDHDLAQPRLISEREDLLVYYGEEARMSLLTELPFTPEPRQVAKEVIEASHAARCLSSKDSIGQVSERRRRELEKAARRVQAADTRMWVALRREYSLAEQFSTFDFTTTVLFEPFGGSFVTTRFAAGHFGWTNSQPLDLVDGYDLLASYGRGLVHRVLDEHNPFLVLIAFDCKFWSLLTNLSPSVDWEHWRETLGAKTLQLVVSICLKQHAKQRYYLVENPAGSLAWIFEHILARLLEEAAGKYVIGDQCAYGHRDLVSQKPVKKPTGWLSNSEAILNKVGKRCRCAWGAHEQLLGSNRGGLRSAQAARYPQALCAAICSGVKHQMEIDYALSMSFRDGQHALAAEDQQDEAMNSDEDPFVTGVYKDLWQLDGDRLIRHHNLPRRKFFSPSPQMKFPAGVKFENILDGRVTELNFVESFQKQRDDSTWWQQPVKETQEFWKGKSIFRLQILGDDEQEDIPMPDVSAPVVAPVPMTPGGRPAPRTPGGTDLRRKREPTRQLQRGFWQDVPEEQTKVLLQEAFDFVQEHGIDGWHKLDLSSDLGERWISHESAQADVQLILLSNKAVRMRKPQPHAGPQEVPLRRSYILLANNKVLSTSWEEWAKMAPSSQVRPLVAKSRRLYAAVFGKFLGEGLAEERDDRFAAKEAERQRKWTALPRELKLAVKRIHVNLGHASVPAMLRALRITKASDTAIKAVRLFRCEDCPRLHENPKEPRPSKLPLVHDFNVQIGLDILTDKDADGQSWSWLSIFDQGTCFHVCALLPQTHQNPTGDVLLEALSSHWLSWAGYPERGVIADRAKYFLSDVSIEFDSHGCHFTTAAKASPWQIGQVERHNGLWKATLERVVWSEQVSGRDDLLLATAAVNMAKNSMSRQHGFSPCQWVTGRDLRLPAALSDEGEAHRIGMMALAETPGSRFFRQNQLRAAARESFARAANDSALRRAELRKIRPTRGPFPVGTYVFYYDRGDRQPGPHNWRGIARVIGHEGQSTVWLSHRGILIAVSPEHLSRAYEEELDRWMAVSHEQALIDTAPAAGGTGFLDLRRGPVPDKADEVPAVEDTNADISELDEQEIEETPPAPEAAPPADVPMPAQAEPEDMSSSSTSMARMKYESERDARRDAQSSDFFKKMREKRETERERRRTELLKQAESLPIHIPPRLPPEAIPAGDEFDPELDDYHTRPTRQLSPLVEAEEEPAEREAKRLRVGEAPEKTDYAHENLFAYMAVESKNFLKTRASQQYDRFEEFYQQRQLSRSQFLFGVKRNDFEERYSGLADRAFAAGQVENPVKKRGRKEIKLSELSSVQQKLFTGPGGSDQTEWEAWLSKDACSVLSPADSAEIRSTKPDLIAPTRWVRTNKNDGLVGQNFKAKSRLVVQGFKDKALGAFRRDAPTASAIAESICLCLVAYFQFTLLAKDIKNAYFSGKSVGREVYLEQPRGGLPNLQPGQLLRANKAIYGFAEAARLFWLALREHLIADGWEESRLEPALFYLRDGGRLRGVLVTHVDDLEGGVEEAYMQRAFAKSALSLEFATNHVRDFIFRGREVKQQPDGHIDVSMRNYAMSMKKISIDRQRAKQLESSLTLQEKELFNSCAGELGWLSRQLRCDLAFENGCIQRAKADPCVADLVRLKSYMGMARRGADFRLRYWSDVDVRNGVIIHLADSGHANGTPEKDSVLRYRSIGGYFVLLADPQVLEGKEGRCNIISYHSSLTKRVCRSTLAAEASHLAEAVEAGDWIAVLLEEALTGDLDLRNWSEVVERRQRVYVTDARSVYDYLAKDASSTSTDKRMAIEGALLRETVKRPGASVRWIDGMQNIADVLTKANVDKSLLHQFIKSGRLSLIQTEQNRALKEKKQQERLNRKVKKDDSGFKQMARDARKAQVAAEVAKEPPSSDGFEPKEK